MAIKSKLVKFLRKLKYNSFHVVIYTIAPEVLVENPRKFNYLLNECEPQSKLWQNILRLSPSKIYEVKDDKILVHSSSYFESSLLLNQLGFKGFSAIGNCYTNPIYRGLGIYGWTIREICIQQTRSKIAIIIAHDNYSSRKGVENAGFKLAGEFILKRFLGIAFGIKKINKQDD